MDNIKPEKKIIFVGMPDMATVCLSKLAKAGFQIVGVVPPHKSHPSNSNMKYFAQALGLVVYEFEESPNEAPFVELMKSLEADIGVVCSYNELLSKEFLATTKTGYINCHPSLLPEYRGANPYHHIILNGETKTGITIHFMDETFDTGDIILQKDVPINEKDTMGTLFNNSNYIFADCLIDILRDYEKTGTLARKPQLAACKKTAPKVDSEITLDFSRPAEEIDRLIRSCNPFFNCNTVFRGTTLKIITADYKTEKHDYKETGHMINHDNRLAIVAKDGYIYPKVVQIGSWGIFDMPEFINKFNPQVNEKLGL